MISGRWCAADVVGSKASSAAGRLRGPLHRRPGLWPAHDRFAVPGLRCSGAAGQALDLDDLRARVGRGGPRTPVFDVPRLMEFVSAPWRGFS